MENQFPSGNLFDVEMDESVKKLLQEIAKWARIVAIAAFAGYGIALADAIVGKNPGGASELAAYAGRASQIAGAIIGGLIGVLINLYLYRFARQTRKGIDNLDQSSLDNGFNNLRIYFKILGILMIVFMGLIILGVLLAILAGSMLQ